MLLLTAGLKKQLDIRWPFNREKDGQKDVQANQELAVPASGKVQESFTQNGAGVKVETSAEAIDSMKEGYVVEVKSKAIQGLPL